MNDYGSISIPECHTEIEKGGGGRGEGRKLRRERQGRMKERGIKMEFLRHQAEKKRYRIGERRPGTLSPHICGAL